MRQQRDSVCMYAYMHTRTRCGLTCYMCVCVCACVRVCCLQVNELEEEVKLGTDSEKSAPAYSDFYSTKAFGY
jgi:hypothetical protein